MSTLGANVDRLQKIFSAEPAPQLPNWNPGWKLNEYRLEVEHFNRRLLEYIRRLLGHITEGNFIDNVSGVGLGDWRYHAASHTFQVKRFDMDGKLGDWEDAPPDQPVQTTDLTDVQYDGTSHTLQKKTQSQYVLESNAVSGWTTWFTPVTATNLVEWHYDATTHKFQYKTQVGYVFEKGSASAYTNAPADQPVSIVRVDRQITYDTGAEQLLEDYVVDVYVLEKGSDTDDNLVAQAQECEPP